MAAREIPAVTAYDDLVGAVCASSAFSLGRVRWEAAARRVWPRTVEFSGIYEPLKSGPNVVFTLFINRRPGDSPGVLYGAYSERASWDPSRYSPAAVARAISARIREIELAARLPDV